MHALVIWAQDETDGYGSDICGRATAALTRAGHTVELIDLRADGFDPVMGVDEWRAYRRLEPALDQTTARYAAALKQAEMLVFVYPTRWFGLPAQLKGWLERVLVPSVAFDLDPDTRRVRGKLGHIRHLVAVTTHESTWPHAKVHGDAGRRTLLWTLRLVCGNRCRSTWLALYAVDRTDDQQRGAFLADVERCLEGPAPMWTTIRPHRRVPLRTVASPMRRLRRRQITGRRGQSLGVVSLVNGLRHRTARGR